MTYVRPFGATPRRLGRAKVVLPLPPYMVPNRENSAVFCWMSKSCPSAFVAVATLPATSQTSPSVHSSPLPGQTVFVFTPNHVEIVLGPAGPCGPVGPTAPNGPWGPVGPTAPVGPVGPTAPVAPKGPCGPVGPTAPVAPVWPCGPC